MSKIISLITNNIKEMKCELAYLSEYKNTENLFKREKIVMHKFICNLYANGRIDYYSGTNFGNRYIRIYMPFIGITKDDVLLEYEYYKDVYKTNNFVGLINKKYGIDYLRIGLYNHDKINREIKNMELDFEFEYI